MTPAGRRAIGGGSVGGPPGAGAGVATGGSGAGVVTEPSSGAVMAGRRVEREGDAHAPSMIARPSDTRTAGVEGDARKTIDSLWQVEAGPPKDSGPSDHRPNQPRSR